LTAAPDVLVIGGGAIGCAVAWELARRHVTVTVVERGAPCREATWAAAGMLSPLGHADRSPAMLQLATTSLDLWPGFAADLLESTGVDVEYRTSGALHVAFDDAEARALEDFVRRGGDFGTELLSAEDARELEPALSHDVRSAAFIARDHRVHNRRLGMALWSACTGAGVTFLTDTTVTALASDDGRFTGVRTARGDTLQAGAVVLATGAWSAGLEGLPRPLPVRPVRGQMLAVEEPRPRHVLHGSSVYLVPRENGHLLVGATVEEVGFRAGPTPGGIASLIRAAECILPDIAEARIVETWAGYRPGTPDALPILGNEPAVSGVYYATGHYRNGILLAPITGQLMAQLIAGEEPVLELGPFGVGRF
jgi:glycine oxidase